jgi:hypothetical protein
MECSRFRDDGVDLRRRHRPHQRVRRMAPGQSRSARTSSRRRLSFERSCFGRLVRGTRSSSTRSARVTWRWRFAPIEPGAPRCVGHRLPDCRPGLRSGAAFPYDTTDFRVRNRAEPRSGGSLSVQTAGQESGPCGSRGVLRLLVGILRLARATPDRTESDAVLEAGVRAALRLAQTDGQRLAPAPDRRDRGAFS